MDRLHCQDALTLISISKWGLKQITQILLQESSSTKQDSLYLDLSIRHVATSHQVQYKMHDFQLDMYPQWTTARFGKHFESIHGLSASPTNDTNSIRFKQT